MAKVLLGVTGSVAAIRVPAMVEALRAAGHTVKIVATDAAMYFFDRTLFASPRTDRPHVSSLPADTDAVTLFADADEWPGERYERGSEVLHIELRRWADLFLIAPVDANTLAKLAVGLCDNCLTCVWRAWDRSRPIVLAPAMNTLMWENDFTRKHLRAIAADHGAGHIPGHFDESQLITAINDRSKTLHVVPPISKELACGDVGVGAMAEVPTVVAAVQTMLTRPPAAG